jgi:hypothetical protein
VAVEMPELWSVLKRIPADDRKTGIYPASTARLVPGSRLRGHCHLSAVFQSEIVVHGMAEFLLAAEIPLGCLNRCVAKEKLNLLKFSACEMA